MSHLYQECHVQCHVIANDGGWDSCGWLIFICATVGEREGYRLIVFVMFLCFYILFFDVFSLFI